MTPKQRITIAAYELFGRNGFNRTTTKEIATKAGTNEATVFRLFKDKATLYDVAAEYCRDAFPYEEMERGLNSSDDAKSTALEFAFILFKTLTPEIQHWPYVVAIERPSERAVKAFEAVNMRFFSMITAWSERMKALGAFRPEVTTPLCCYLLMLVLNEFKMDVVSHGKLETEARQQFLFSSIPSIVDMWWNGVAARN